MSSSNSGRSKPATASTVLISSLVGLMNTPPPTLSRKTDGATIIPSPSTITKRPKVGSPARGSGVPSRVVSGITPILPTAAPEISCMVIPPATRR